MHRFQVVSSDDTVDACDADARASAVRKSYLPFYKRLYRVSRTYFSANILGAAADCTVSVAVDTYRCSIDVAAPCRCQCATMVIVILSFAHI